MAKDVTIVFNYRSPFCALIVDRFFRLTRSYDVRLEWKIAREVPRPSSFPITEDNPRFQYNRQDCERRAKWLGLDWKPQDWRLGGVESASLLGQHLLDTASPVFATYTVAMNRAYWCNGLNASDPAVVRQLALSVGVSKSELFAAEKRTEILTRELDDTQAWCSHNGVLGVPFFIAGEQRFWGSDRFAALLRHLSDLGCGEPSAELVCNLI